MILLFANSFKIKSQPKNIGELEKSHGKLNILTVCATIKQLLSLSKKLKLMRYKITILLLALTASICNAQKKVNKSFDGIEEIDISTASGAVTFTKSSGNKVTVDLTYYYDDDEYSPIFEQNGNSLTIKEEFKGNNTSGKSPIWNLSIPDDLEISFASGSGSVTAENFKAEFEATVGSGSMEFTNIKGKFSSTSGSGSIKYSNCEGKIKATVGSGNIKGNNLNGDIRFVTGSGNVRMDTCEGGISAISGSGNVTAEDIVVTDNSSFTSGSGDAEVTLAKPLDGDIRVTSGSGDAVLDFNGAAISGKITMKASKRNGDISAPFKFDEETEEGDGRDTMIVKKASIGNGDNVIKVSTGSGEAEIKK